MNVYPLLVLTHILAAAALFAAFASEAARLRTLRLAETPGAATLATRLLTGPPILGPVSMVALLASGIWMMALSWGHEPWIVVALLGIVAMGALGGAVTSRRIRQLRGALEAEDRVNLLDAFRCGGAMTALSASLRVRIGIAIGIVALMTLKPAGWATSLLLLAAATAGGAVASLRLAGRSGPLPARGPA